MSSKILLICIISLTVFTFGDSIHREETDYSETEIIRDLDFPNEQILSETENAYNPIPSPDGKTIAYVETGWDRNAPFSSLGRSNLKSNIKLMDSNGKILSKQRLADSFLHGWTADGKNLIAFRDWEYSVLSADDGAVKEKFIPNHSSMNKPPDKPEIRSSERFAYLEKENVFIWIQNEYQNHRDKNEKSASYYSTHLGSTIKSSKDDAIASKGFIRDDNMLVPSPDGRYIAMIGTAPTDENNFLQIYDRNSKIWTNLGKFYIHPDADWSYTQPSWNPWFADSSKLVFMSYDGIVISSPDGKDKKIVLNKTGDIGIPAASPDGKNIAYLSAEPRPMGGRPDLRFYGGTTIWVIDSEGKTSPRAVTRKNADETLCIRWLNNRQIVFDRIADEEFYKKARLWKADVFAQTK